MANQNHNPFVLPGLGQAGEMAQNPIMASMEMMRQAWQGLASTPGLGHSALAAPMSLEDLDRRIADLRAVENWLRMNLSMLSSTIQGMEVQRSTISTLKSFVDATARVGASPDGRSPLEVVLGIQHPAKDEAGSSVASASKSVPAEQTSAAEPTAEQAPAGAEEAFNAQAVAAAAQGWWEMVQKQFDTLAAATSATLQGAEEARKAAQGDTAQDPPEKSASRPAKKAPRKAAPASTPPRTAKKTAARKSSASRKT